jgi:hypothetical protein
MVGIQKDEMGYYRNCPVCKIKLYNTLSHLRDAIRKERTCKKCMYSDKFKNKLSLCRKGKKFSDEHKRNLSLAKQGCFNFHKYKRPFEWAYNNLQSASKYRNLKCILSYEDFLKFVNITNCHYCDQPIDWHKHRKIGQSTAYNIDRKNNNIGYVYDNCVVCCQRCNKVKSNEFNYEEMIKIGKVIKEIDKDKLLVTQIKQEIGYK